MEQARKNHRSVKQTATILKDVSLNTVLADRIRKSTISNSEVKKTEDHYLIISQENKPRILYNTANKKDVTLLEQRFLIRKTCAQNNIESKNVNFEKDLLGVIDFPAIVSLKKPHEETCVIEELFFDSE